MTETIRVGVMGASLIGRRHGKAFGAIPGTEVLAIAEPNDTLRKQFVEEFGAKHEYKNYREMVSAGDLDAVAIGLPTHLHAEASFAALDADMHVLCEKPPTRNAEEMIVVARKAHESGLTYAFGRQFRFANASLAARDLTAAGKLGSIYHAEARWVRTRHMPRDGRAWMTDKARGGGVLLDLGIHAIDEGWFIMGCPRPVEVFAGMHCAFGHIAPEGQVYTADDTAVGAVRFENGATLHFITSFSLNWPTTAKPKSPREPVNGEVHEATIYGSHGGLQIRGGGEEGTQVVGEMTGVRVSAIPTEKLTGAEAVDQMFQRQDEDFARAIREGGTPTNSAEQAVMLMQVLDALRESGDTQKAVAIGKGH